MRSGYCCVSSDVTIVDLEGAALRHKPNNTRCPYLEQDEQHRHSCQVHAEWWYEATPCAQHNTFLGETRDCTMGAAIHRQDPQIPNVIRFIRHEAPQASMQDLRVVKQYRNQQALIKMLKQDLKYKHQRLVIEEQD